MELFESFQLIGSTYPNFTLFPDTDKCAEALGIGDCPVFEKWGNAHYQIEFRAEPFRSHTPFSVECTSFGMPFDIDALPVREESDKRPSLIVKFHGIGPFYEPEEAEESLANLKADVTHAIETCSLIERRVPELFPGYSVYTPSKDDGSHVSHNERCISDLKIIRRERGEYGEVVAFESDWLLVVFTKFSESLLDISLHAFDFKIRIEAHPQPRCGIIRPTLFVCPRLVFHDYKTIEPLMERCQNDAKLAVEVCAFLRRQVGELFPGFIL